MSMHALKKCINSFPYFCSLITLSGFDYTKSPHENNGTDRMKFVLRPYQKDYIKYIESPGVDKTILKLRQSGFSMTTLAYILWLILYGDGERIIYTIDKVNKCYSMVRKMRSMYDSLPNVIKPKAKFTALAVKCRGNELEACTASSDAGRSGTYTLSFGDEYDIYTNRIQHDMNAAMASASPIKRVIFSTPREEDGIFHNLIKKARASNTLFEATAHQEDILIQQYGTLENAKLWLEAAEAKSTPAQMRKEYYGEFRGIAESPVWRMRSEYMVDAKNIEHLEADIVGMDVGWSDATVILYAKSYQGVLYIVDEAITTEETTGEIYNKYMSMHDIKWGAIDSSSKKVDMTSSYSPHRKFRELTKAKFYTHKRDRSEMIEITKTLLFQNMLKISSKCTQLLKMLYNYEYNDKGELPRDKYKHWHDAFVYLGLNYVVKNKYIKTMEMGNRPRIIS